MSTMIKTTVLLGVIAIVGCSKPSPEEQKKKEEAFAASLTSAMVGSGAAPSAAAAAPGAFVGSCTDNESRLCNEFLGALPLGAEDSCKLLEGVFSKTARCPTDKLGAAPLAGICTIKAEGDDRIKKSHSYLVDKTTLKATAESAKVMCDLQTGTFVATPSTAVAATPAAKATAAPKKK